MLEIITQSQNNLLMLLVLCQKLLQVNDCLVIVLLSAEVRRVLPSRLCSLHPSLSNLQVRPRSGQARSCHVRQGRQLRSSVKIFIVYLITDTL